MCYAVTPHAVHPFALAVRAVQWLGIKQRLAKAETEHLLNDYPAYYRLNSRRQVERQADGLGFTSATVYDHPSTQWKQYVPRPLRFLPWTYDRLLGARFQRFSQQFMFRLDRETAVTSPKTEN